MTDRGSIGLVRQRCRRVGPRWQRLPQWQRLSRLAIVIVLLPAVHAAAGEPRITEDGRLDIPPTVPALDAHSVFRFAAMSDHKGLAPVSSVLMKHCVAQISAMKCDFVIGLGDHLKKGRENPFLGFIRENPFWSRRFYPNIADGENEYYGTGQGDWGAGRKLLTHLGMENWPEVVLRENGCEYYARIAAGPYRVHLIQLHYSDKPLDAAVAFREDSRRYLLETLGGIDKRPGRDIIIAAAHTGDWLRSLSGNRRSVVLDKVDLVLGATIHRFVRYSHGDRGALVLNTGSVGFAGDQLDNYHGWLSVHVLANPLALVVQYQDARRPDRQIVDRRFGYVKIIGGRIHPLRFVESRTDDKPE